MRIYPRKMHVEARGDSRSRETAGKHFQPKACVSRSPVKGRRQGKIVDGSVELPPSSRSRSETVWFDRTRNVVTRPNELHKRSEIEKRVEYFERGGGQRTTGNATSYNSIVIVILLCLCRTLEDFSLKKVEINTGWIDHPWSNCPTDY